MGTQHRTFLLTYRYEGSEWVVELPARDIDDARARLARLPFANIDGELKAKVPAALGPLALLTVAFRNGLATLSGSRR
jgi:hypothetical protein